MAPQWRVRKKKKAKSGGGVAAGIVPSASIATLPGTTQPTRPQNPMLSQTAPLPPPPPPPPLPLTLSHTHAPFGTHVLPAEELQADETDTSLYDYENAKETYPFGSGLYDGQRSATHGPPPPPPPEFDDDRPHLRDDDSESLPSRSSKGRKKRIRDRLSSPDSTLRRSLDEPKEASGRHSLAGSVHFGSRHQGALSSGDWEVEEKERSMREMTPLPSELSWSTSQKLASLQRSGSGLLQSQQLLEAQLRVERRQEPGASQQDVHSVADGTLRKQDELIETLRRRANVLTEENGEVVRLNEQLTNQVAELRRLHRDGTATTQGVAGGAGADVGVLRKQLADCKEERDVLKVVTQRVNCDLARYQAEYRHLTQAELQALPGLPYKGPKPSWLINTKYLAPLLVAYDDRLNTKQDIIDSYQGELEGLRRDAEKIVKENERLHVRLEQTDVSGPVSMTEWRQLQEQCKLVLEENALILEQLELQRNKMADINKDHIMEASKLSQRLLAAEAAQKAAEMETAEVKCRYDNAKHCCEVAVVDNESRMPIDAHLTALSGLRMTMDDQVSNHSKEVDNINSALQKLKVEKRSFESEKQQLITENKQLRIEVKIVSKSQRKLQRRMLMVQKALASAESKEIRAEHYLKSVVQMAEMTALERDTFAEAVEKQDNDRVNVLKKVFEGNVVAGQVEQQLQKYKIKVSEKLEKVVDKMMQQGDRQRHEYDIELTHLRRLVNEKQGMLKTLSCEKKQVECELETLWQVASEDSRQMRDTMTTSVRKLREHPHLHDVIADTEEPSRLIIDLSEGEQ